MKKITNVLIFIFGVILILALGISGSGVVNSATKLITPEKGSSVETHKKIIDTTNYPPIDPEDLNMCDKD